jgi:two-component system phosphate regulon sensor histidine kinase PhoR
MNKNRFNFVSVSVHHMARARRIRHFANSVPLLLMGSSIMLLLVLQFLWLKSAYDDARERFQKETNNLFRNTIFTLHDSLIVRSIAPLHPDSVPAANHFRINRPQRHLNAGGSGRDSLTQKQAEAYVEIFVSSDSKDSIGWILRPLARRMRMDRNSRKYFIRFGPDSLRKDSIAYHFSRVLSHSGISLPFNVHFIRTSAPGRPNAPASSKGTLMSEIVPFTPVAHYAVSFPRVNSFFLTAIAPQILFSVFLTLLTAGSFYLMYRSVTTQKKLMEMKNDFISNMTHELKTPVSTVSVALEAMERFHGLDDPKKASEYLSMAQHELKRLVFMTDKILETASFENKDPEMELHLIDFQALVTDVIKSMKPIFDKRNVHLLFESKGSDFCLKGSRAHLLTVLYNLFDNAIKYSPESSSIVVDLEDKEDVILFTIRDEGIGIPAIYHKKIFEKFFRVPTGDVHNAKGYGLGLSYVARVVERHTGEIKVASEPGKGSRFTITLPRNGVQ